MRYSPLLFFIRYLSAYVSRCRHERMLRRRAEMARLAASRASQAQAFRAWRLVFCRKQRLADAKTTVEKQSHLRVLAKAMKVWQRTRELKHIVRNVHVLQRRNRLQWGLIALARYCAMQRAYAAVVKVADRHRKRAAFVRWAHRFREAGLVEEYVIGVYCVSYELTNIVFVGRAQSVWVQSLLLCVVASCAARSLPGAATSVTSSTCVTLPRR